MVKPVKFYAVVVMLGLMVGIKGSSAESARRTVKVTPAVSTDKTASTEKASVSLAAVVAPAVAGDSASAGLDSALAAPAGEEYRLKMHHLHTGESIDVVYRIGDTYLPEAMDKLNYFLRDHRTQDVSSYDPKEFDLLHRLLAKLGKSNSEIDVVCGYRTPWSNHFLRTRAAVTGVAQHSQHMLGKAIDLRVPGVATAKLRDAALALHGGGVGYYPVSQFVHVDVGPVRRWSFAGVGE